VALDDAEVAGRAGLLDAIRKVVAGDALLSPLATRTMIARVLAQPEPSAMSTDALDRLTAREREILRLVALGFTNDQIADQLFISSTTAKTHVNRAMMKLGVRDRAQLVIVAYETGLVTPLST
jgi:DNA-binding NarL/FixJ family response regulator